MEGKFLAQCLENTTYWINGNAVNNNDKHLLVCTTPGIEPDTVPILFILISTITVKQVPLVSPSVYR